MYLRGEPDYLNEDWAAKTIPIQMGSVQVGQAIRDENNAYFNLLDNFNVGLALSAIFLLSFLGILSLAFLINKLTERIRFDPSERSPTKISKAIASTVASLGMNQLSAIGIFVLFVNQYLWLAELFITNNVKTNKVVRLSLKIKISKLNKFLAQVVDTNFLIRDQSDILSSRKVACMVQNEPVYVPVNYRSDIFLSQSGLFSSEVTCSPARPPIRSYGRSIMKKLA